MDPDHLCQFVEQTRQERVIDFQILSKRSSRLVCRIETLTGVFAVKADEQVDAFRPEIEALNYLVDHAFPVQTPVGGMPGPPAILMLPWSEGVSLNGHASPQALHQVGALLARLHRLPGTRPLPAELGCLDARPAETCPGLLAAEWDSSSGSPRSAQSVFRPSEPFS